ncbi:uridine kinase [Winogradskya consettensis]|uniref:Uridine kinase n=1 Tax=Winogradskya consettensis TaxID=113560 RepID=A0A919T5U7_9ACTN|nr:uridine kinase [Actinoplanes consettensis]GIM85442.1 uridine kinase [Actinoplanes consettensis]
MQVRPLSLENLTGELADRVVRDWPDGRVRVAIDGADAADPGALADALVTTLRVLGRPAVRITAGDFLRPASVRLEFGRTNPDSYYAGWLDEPGLRREVLDPAGPGGSGRIVPRLWDAAIDRAAREPYAELAPNAVVIVDGPLLLGAGLPFDLTVHLELSAGALARRTEPARHWTLPALARYDDEVAPSAFADVVVRLDDPRHPAVVLRRE